MVSKPGPNRPKKVKVYVEGGSVGEGKNESVNIEFRRAFARLAGKLGIIQQPQFVPCGGRDGTVEAAWNAFINRSNDELILMLVDGEDPSKEPVKDCWKHLKNRGGKKWNMLEERHAPYIFMMATCMETWLIADLDALRNFFDGCFNENPVKSWPNLEIVPRSSAFNALQSATSRCGENQYDKGEISFQALGQIDPIVVAEKCPHAKLFFERLPLLCRTRTRPD